MKTKEKGLYNKYVIRKSDGSIVNPNADYFVLRLDKDGEKNHVNACRKAILLYANEIKSYLPELSKDLIDKYS